MVADAVTITVAVMIEAIVVTDRVMIAAATITDAVTVTVMVMGTVDQWIGRFPAYPRARVRDITAAVKFSALHLLQ